jgi:transposase-like protein
MECPKCGGSHSVKAGFAGGKQRHKCKDCGYYYTVALKSTAQPLSVKKNALRLYLEGLGFRSIGRFIGVSNVSVLRWVRTFGQAEKSLSATEQTVEVVEIDEMHSYVCQKKTIVGYG